VSCIDDISEVDVGRTVTLTYTAPDEGIQVLFVVCGGKAPPGASVVGELGNNDPAENFKKRDLRHAARAQNSESVEGLGARSCYTTNMLGPFDKVDFLCRSCVLPAHAQVWLGSWPALDLVRVLACSGSG